MLADRLVKRPGVVGIMHRTTSAPVPKFFEWATLGCCVTDGSRSRGIDRRPTRLKVLKTYGILDTAPEDGFDDVVQLAAALCGRPVALVRLVTDDRQWFKARLSFPPCETDRSVGQFVLGEPDIS